MSRGPGRIERAVRHLLESNPSGAFTLNDFVGSCYPGINRIEKKHRVSILRALNKVCDDLWWASEFINGRYGERVYYNLLNLHSYAVGRTVAHKPGDPSPSSDRNTTLSAIEAERMLLAQHLGSQWRSPRDESRLVRTDGPYPLAVEMWRARRAGNSERSEALKTAFHNAVHVSVYRPKVIIGEIHPDFLRDCVTAITIAA